MNYNWFSSSQLMQEKIKSYQETAIRERQTKDLREKTRQLEAFGQFFLALNFAALHNR